MLAAQKESFFVNEVKQMGVTAFGKELRKMRIDASEVLGTMATKIGVSSAYLSSIENGQRDIPDSLIPALAKAYGLSKEKQEELEELKAQVKGAVDVDFKDKKDNADYVETAVMFARDFSKLSEEQILIMKGLLEKFKAEQSGVNIADRTGA